MTKYILSVGFAIILVGSLAPTLAQQATGDLRHVDFEPSICTKVMTSSGSEDHVELNRVAKGSLADPAELSRPTINEAKTSRWFELQTATLGLRYRMVENSDGRATNNQVQHSANFRARIKFDRQGSYNLFARVASGNSFSGAWNTTGIGTGKMFSNLYLKQLYLSATPFKTVEVQYGGIAVARGESTEITSYDSDAYIVGQRLVITAPKYLYFDNVSVTYAYLGDFNQPSFTKRWRRLGESNYHQFLVTKKLGKRASFSIDYTFKSGINTLREALRVSTSELRVVDALRFETYQRGGPNRDGGFAVTAEKAISKRLRLDGGYSQIDRAFGGLNGDRYNRGKLAFLSSDLTLTPELTFQAFVGRGFSNDYATPNRTRVDLIFSYNLLRSLQRTRFL